jgi:hypothetical protein
MSVEAENSETVRRRGRRKHIFVAPRSDATLLHLVKMFTSQTDKPTESSFYRLKGIYWQKLGNVICDKMHGASFDWSACNGSDVYLALSRIEVTKNDLTR